MKRIAHVVLVQGNMLVQTPATNKQLIETGRAGEVKMDFTRNPQFLERPGNNLTSYVTVGSDFESALESLNQGIRFSAKDAENTKIPGVHEGITIVRGTEAGGVFVPEKIGYNEFFRKIQINVHIKSEKDVLKMSKRLKRLFAVNHGVCVEGKVVETSTAANQILGDGFKFVDSELIRFKVQLENKEVLTVRVVKDSPFTDGISTITQTGAKKLGIDPSFRNGEQVTMLFPNTSLGGFAKGLLGVVADSQQQDDLVIIGPKKEISAAGGIFWFASMMPLSEKTASYTDTISITNFKGLQPLLADWGRQRITDIVKEAMDEAKQRARIESVVEQSLALSDPESRLTLSVPGTVRVDTWALTEVIRHQMKTGQTFSITSVPALFRRIFGSYKIELENMVQGDLGQVKAKEKENRRPGQIRIRIPEEHCASGYLCTELPTILDGEVVMNIGVLSENEAFCRGRQGIGYIIRRPNAKPSSYLKKRFIGLDEIKARIDSWAGLEQEAKEQLKQQWEGYVHSPWLFLSVEDVVTRTEDLRLLDGADNDDLTVAIMQTGLPRGFSFGDQRFPAAGEIPDHAKLLPEGFTTKKSDEKPKPFVLDKGVIARAIYEQMRAISIGVFVNPTIVFSNLCQRFKSPTKETLAQAGIEDISWMAHHQETLIDGVNTAGVSVSPASSIARFWATVPVIPGYCKSRVPSKVMTNNGPTDIDEVRAKCGRRPVEMSIENDNEVDKQLNDLRQAIKALDVDILTIERHLVQTVMPEQRWWKAVQAYPIPEKYTEIAQQVLLWHKRNIKNNASKFFQEILEELAESAKAQGRDSLGDKEVKLADSQSKIEAVVGRKTKDEYKPGAVHQLWQQISMKNDAQYRTHLVLALLKEVYGVTNWTYVDKETGQERPRSVGDGFLWSGRMIEHTLEAITTAMAALPADSEETTEAKAIEQPKVKMTIVNGSVSRNADALEAWKAKFVGTTATAVITPDGRIVIQSGEETLGQVAQRQAEFYVSHWGQGSFPVQIEPGSQKTLTAVVQY